VAREKRRERTCVVGVVGFRTTQQREREGESGSAHRGWGEAKGVRKEPNILFY
jgi:hypothetical protein